MVIGSGACPDCGKRSIHRHGWHERYLQDLPAQGAPATVKLRLQRGSVEMEPASVKARAGEFSLGPVPMALLRGKAAKAARERRQAG
ncbi:transposase family protein [Methylocystis hirsuta]